MRKEQIELIKIAYENPGLRAGLLPVILKIAKNENVVLDSRSATEILDILRQSSSKEIKAKKISDIVYRHRRKGGLTEAPPVRTIEFDKDTFLKAFESKSGLGPENKTLMNKSSGWVQFTILSPEDYEDLRQHQIKVNDAEKRGNEKELQALKDKAKAEKDKTHNISFYASVGYKDSFKSAKEDEILKDWGEVLGKCVEKIFSDGDHVVFKFTAELGKFQGDHDNLKIYKKVPKESGVSSMDRIQPHIEKAINESRFFTTRSRDLTSVAIEDHEASYGMLICAHTANQIVNHFYEDLLEEGRRIKEERTKKTGLPVIQTDPNVLIQFVNRLVKTVDPMKLKHNFDDQNGALAYQIRTADF